ncbi:stage V sporulation protein AD [Paenibacillus xerothermodurans]|uniref:Stage V sporulation protein AD n=1 Tax=Paenibacillus xerothermodurans TaxID=1977292 RepID=A0A2W1NTC9_PAEXE|nr:stage V sporulation protein AD [Paenibacillus xerothermodurans]PZE22765.1 stage V sporulation protein AD [Paenibacillus xerothermodurans]
MLQGHQSWAFPSKPVIISTGTVVGPEEGKGPLVNDFDLVHGDTKIKEDTWEKSERRLMEEAAEMAIRKAGLTKEDIDFYIGGDLMNQIISNTFALRTLAIPYLGVFGACSTAMESLAIAAMMIDAGNANRAMAGTCSHNSSSEKQYRYPTEYGAQKPPSAQYTVTGAGAAVVANSGEGPVVTGATIGRVTDMGLKDPFNMGAAMAPAAVDTMQAHFRDFQREPGYYDLILTGDLSKVGVDIAKELLAQNKVPIEQTTYSDCGLMIYDRDKQPVASGASGCACSAVVTYGHIMRRIKKGELNKVLIVGTGALLSPLTYQQGESIPCIAHAVAIESGVS